MLSPMATSSSPRAGASTVARTPPAVGASRTILPTAVTMPVNTGPFYLRPNTAAPGWSKDLPSPCR
jgi:hypothetical protein